MGTKWDFVLTIRYHMLKDIINLALNLSGFERLFHKRIEN